MSLITQIYPEFSQGIYPFNLIIIFPLFSFWLKEESAVLKFSEQGGTPQAAAPSSSLTANLRSLSKGDSPVASPFQNYSSIHSQSRSTSSPSLHSRSPSISNMAALRWVSSVGCFLVLTRQPESKKAFSWFWRIWNFCCQPLGRFGGKTAIIPVVLPVLLCCPFSVSHVWRPPVLVIKSVISFVLSGSSLMNIGCKNILVRFYLNLH